MGEQSEAVRIKNEGNALFAKGDYAGADSCYSRAIVLAPDMTSLYTNRAMCRFNLKDYDGVVADCTACIGADPSSVKANYYLSKALSALGDHQSACAKAIEAYELCRHSDSDKSLVMTHDWLLRCKSERWRDAERRRVREHRDLENEVLALLVKDRDENVAAVGDDEMEKTAITEESESKMAQIREVFERARKEDDKKREVPEWLIDDISFDVMTDPIITGSGRSYQRSSIIAAINAKAVDPVTRETLTKDELRPNLALKQACEWYLSNNGWAYDW